MGKMISPNDLHQAAIRMQLGGKTPSTHREWMLCVNFWAFNVEKGLEVSLCKVMKMLYHCPLSDAQVESIARYQQARKH